MKKELKDAVGKWISFTETIRNMYLKLIELEQQDLKDSEEYKTIVYLLPEALKIENRIINDIPLTKDNYQEIKDIIDSNIDQIIIDILNETSNKIEVVRRSNRLDILLLEYNNFFELTPTNNLMEAIKMLEYQDELTNYKYANEYLEKLSVNHIAMIERMIQHTDDKKIRNFLISLKYRTICITPAYESNFAFFKCRVLPTININLSITPLDNLKEEVIRELNEFNLRNSFKADLLNILYLDNDSIKEPDNIKQLYRILTLNKARLISLDSTSFVESIYNETLFLLPMNENYSEVVKLVNNMFEDATNYLKDRQIKLKKSDY